VKAGDFVIAGENLVRGGSSRETAPGFVEAPQTSARVTRKILCQRIFFRNAINLGLLCVIADTDGIDERDELELDVPSQTLRNKTKGQDIRSRFPA
jgi:3-isopropylmalate dehydratase small subunit